MKERTGRRKLRLFVVIAASRSKNQLLLLFDGLGEIVVARRKADDSRNPVQSVRGRGESERIVVFR